MPRLLTDAELVKMERYTSLEGVENAAHTAIELRKMLREVEFGAVIDGWPACPLCGDEPHSPGCRLAALLEPKA